MRIYFDQKNNKHIYLFISWNTNNSNDTNRRSRKSIHAGVIKFIKIEFIPIAHL